MPAPPDDQKNLSPDPLKRCVRQVMKEMGAVIVAAFPCHPGGPDVCDTSIVDMWLGDLRDALKQHEQRETDDRAD